MMELEDIKHVEETTKTNEANEFMAHGWQLLQVGKDSDLDEMGQPFDRTRYTLGADEKVYKAYPKFVYPENKDDEFY